MVGVGVGAVGWGPVVAVGAVAILEVSVSLSTDQWVGNVAMDLPNAGEGYEADEKDRGLHVGQIERRYREGLGFTARAEGILEG